MMFRELSIGVSLLMPVVVIVAACSAPHRDYDEDKIKTVDNLPELMHVQATVADPCFALRKDLSDDAITAEKITDAQWAQFADMGVRLQATSARIKEFSKGEGFDEWNAAIGRDAKALVGHANKRDKAGTLGSVGAIKKSCKACHSQYR